MRTKRLRRAARRIVDYLSAAHVDLRLWLTGKSDPELPPLRLRFVGVGDFRAVGKELASLLVNVGNLHPSDRVLDIGCGVGRVAIPLTRYLDSDATYDGFDVVMRAIRWCQRNITPRYPNFRFHHVDVANTEYRSRGVPASDFRFPFADQSFDFAFATSLFTHLVADEMQQYLCETARLLAPDGRLLATFFLLNDVSLASLGGRDQFNFPFVRGVMRLLDPDNPGVGVAIEQHAVLRMAVDAGLIVEQIEYGSWSGRPGAATFQDAVVCRRA
jgi:SAM-dependent methyltransferase